MDSLWRQLYAIEDLLKHLERYRQGWREHVKAARLPEPLKAAVASTCMRPGIEHRSLEPVARLTDLNVRTIRRRIADHYDNRAAFLYYCARPPTKPAAYGVGTVFVSPGREIRMMQL